MKTVYISGKISGLCPLKADALFSRAARHILNEGNTPRSPYHEIGPLIKLRPPMSKKKLWRWCMKKAIAILCECDEIALLPNYRKSKGARIELKLARKIGIPVRYL